MIDRETATRIIRNTFEKTFDKTRFINFSKNLVNYLDTSGNFSYQGNYIPDAYKPYIQTLERIGQYQDSDSKTIEVLIVQLKKETSLEHARTMQRNFIAWYLDGSRGGDLRDAALVAVISPDSEDWRFSLVKMEYSLGLSEKTGRLKTEKLLTPARRYSFLVGSNESSHTAQMQLIPILQDDKNNPTLTELENAFSIEVVTKEFFEKYRELFHKVEESLQKVVNQDKKIREDFDAKDVNTISFSKKFLGQIVFLYFLQKKGWMGVPENERWGNGDRRFLRTLFIECKKNKSSYFNDYLEHLFYDALNNQNRGGIDPSYYPKFDCRIPFLNGGLFDPINNYDWMNTDICLSNELFSNNEKTKEGDTGTGILDIFDRYNFTVKEDEPLDKEVAVDPEMLGKVFENLLEVKDRKSKGTYYTPREIVHYMCQESLINYLDTALNTEDVALVGEKPTNLKLFGAPAFQQQALKTPGSTNKIPREDIEIFIRSGDLVAENDTQVESNGKETERYSYKLPASIRQHAALIDDKLADIRVCDPAVGSGAFPVGLMTEIVRARNTLTAYLPNKTERNYYNFKRHAIQNCLYGVDIDPGAVEIAKLRLWLSLVVDEEDIKSIRPLPNLDYKIVCGNSLLGIERNMFNNELFQKLEELKPLYFNETNAGKKQSYRNDIDDLIGEITHDKQKFDLEVYFSEIFHENPGFDLIIANPPYIFSREKLTAKDKLIYKRNYSLTQFKINLYILFTERAYNILNSSGCLAFIMPNNWLTLSTNSDLRYFLLAKTYDIRVVLNYDRVFENASVDTCILIFRKIGDSKISSYHWTEHGVELMGMKRPNHYLERSGHILGDLADNGSVKASTICDKIDSKATILSVLADVKNGVQAYTVGEGDPIQTKEMKINRVYHSDVQKNKTWIKYLDGVDVCRYKVGWSGQFIKYGNNLTRPRKPTLFIGERLLVRQIPGHLPYCIHACHTDEHTINDNNSMIIKMTNDEINLKYILGIINSKLISFWFAQSFGKLQRKIFPQFKVKELRTFPIKVVSPDDQLPVISKVEKILTAKQAQTEADTSIIEQEIDRLVYELYELTPEEIAVVEGVSK